MSLAKRPKKHIEMQRLENNTDFQQRWVGRQIVHKIFVHAGTFRILVDARLPRHCVAVLVARVEDDLLSLPQFWRVWHGVPRRKLNISQNGPKPEALPILSTSQQRSVRSSDIFCNKAWEMHGKIWTAKSMLQGTNISTPSRHFWVDDFPNFLRWDIDSFPGGWILHELLFFETFLFPTLLAKTLVTAHVSPGWAGGSSWKLIE